MLSRSVQLRRIAAARPTALAQWRRAGMARPFGATALLAKRKNDSSDKLYTADQMNDLIRGVSSNSSKTANAFNWESARDARPQQAASTAEVEHGNESRDTVETRTDDSNSAQEAGMPDIENWKPTDADLAELMSTLQSGASDEGLSTDEAAVADLDAEYKAAHDEYDDLASEDDLLFGASAGEGLPKSRPFNHELLTHEHLGVSALGRPVEALIIKNPNRMQRTRKEIPIFEPEATTGAPKVELRWSDYVAKPDDEQDPVLEAWDNIDEMRPTDTQTVSMYEYHTLVAGLVEGFTQGQLSSYITMKHAQELEKQEATEEPQRYPWIQKQTPWQAAYKIELEGKTPKYTCAATIVDKVWKLHVREQVESLGRALLWVDPITFRLLTEHARPVLESIQREMLNPQNNERLAAKSEESRIGIYASKAAILPIIARLHEAAQAVTSTRLSTEHVKKENLKQTVLDNLSRITNTMIEKRSSGQELIVHWIANGDRPKSSTQENDTSTTPEGPADIVWRLLMVAQPGPDAEDDFTRRMITRTAQGKKARDAIYMDYHREWRSKSWRDKLRSWTRYASSVTVPEMKTKKLQPLQLASRVELAQLSSPATSDAAPISDVAFAIFGHVLHDQDVAKASGKTANRVRRVLSPVIPHPAALTTLSTGDEPVTQSTAIILNFSPDTTQNDSPQPRIRLTLPVDETTDLSNFDIPPDSTLHAVAAQRIQDLLLPSESVDVRLTQQQLVALDTNQPALKQFLSASEFNLLQGRLRTPSRIAFTLPGAGTEVPYLFMGLEVHQTVETSLRGHTVRYASIEAGQHGGQRQELSVHQAPGKETDSFLQLVEDVAAGEVFSWNDGPALMQQRSSETFSMDMLEDAVQADEGEAVAGMSDDAVLPLEEEDDVVVVEESTQDETAEDVSVAEKKQDELIAEEQKQDEAVKQQEAILENDASTEETVSQEEVDSDDADASESTATQANGDDTTVAPSTDPSKEPVK